ncbi:MAG: cell division protein FtsW [Ruminococcaceae bacterium]|nr:cell division protein FtsW [Oscillospiraceae bacterium]
MNNNQPNRTSHARRRPDERVGKQAGATQNEHRTRGTQPVADRKVNERPRRVEGAKANPPKKTGQDYKFSAGKTRRPPQNAKAAQHVTDMSTVEDKRMARRESRALKEYRREEAWQNEVVRVRGGIDVFMLAIILILLALGSITVFSASYPRAIAANVGSGYYIKKQIGYLIGGFAAMFLAAIIPMKAYRKWAPPLAYALSAALLIAVLFVGKSVGEATRWIKIGSFTIQPSELMKVALVLMLAWFIERHEHKMSDLDRGLKSYWHNTFYPLLVVGIASGLVLIGNHLSGAVIVAGIGIFMLAVGGSRNLWLWGTVIPVGLSAFIVYLQLNPYALKRFTSFTDENADVLSDVWQTTQSVYAIGSGGLFGKGFGQSQQKYGFLGNAHTDFIFSVWCEELGFIGAVALVLLFLLFIWRGYVIALRAPDKFMMLTAFGITTHIGIQAFLNMAVASDMIFNTGVTLPFFSYGGSALIVLMGEVGILLSISRQYYRKKTDIEHEEMLKKAGLM